MFVFSSIVKYLNKFPIKWPFTKKKQAIINVLLSREPPTRVLLGSASDPGVFSFGKKKEKRLI